jgi:hypothetical protein
MFGIILALLGFMLLALAAAQHFLGLNTMANLSISHLAVYLGIAGVVLLIPGVWLTLRKGGN